MRILFITLEIDENSLGRTYCLWLMARRLGWQTNVVATRGERLWSPVVGTEFGDEVEKLVPGNPDEDARLHALAARADLIVAVKPLPDSFGRALRVARATRKPLLLDIDDPDLEAWYAPHQPLKAVGKAILKPQYFWPAIYLRQRARRIPVIVSNPTLQKTYGGTLVPHVREDTGEGMPHTSSTPTVVFVGTNRPHKGVPLLRKAVSELQQYGVKLVITDRPPADAAPWERWTGQTSLAEGADLVRRGDIVVLPSTTENSYAFGQLPAKLIDAMIAGRAVAVSDTGPMTWAVGDAGVHFRADDPEGPRKAIEQLISPDVRERLGHAARERALSMFTLESVLPRFEQACRTAISALDTSP